ncbi:YvcK family protein [bacterium]|nr:MAG: YvcK family protein [bacterium]
MSETKKIVVMGGGTGTFTVLQGLKKYPFELFAIVAMTDDGGSSGILRDELGVLPPGDLRQCLVALSESPEILRDIFNYRFSKGSMKGHNLGNLLISALETMKGGLDKALPYLNQILALRGEAIPITFDKVKLVAKLENGQVLSGEHLINTSKFLNKNHLIKRLFTQPKAMANPKAIKAIEEANAIVIGPGNLYCSLLPLFLIEGITKVLRDTKAKIIYNVNLMTKLGHTDGFSVFDFVKKVEEYIGNEVIDYVLFNNKKPSVAVLKKYAFQGEIVKVPQGKQDRKSKKIFIGKNLISKEIYEQKASDLLKRNLIRHDSDKLAKIISEIIK